MNMLAIRPVRRKPLIKVTSTSVAYAGRTSTYYRASIGTYPNVTEEEARYANEAVRKLLVRVKERGDSGWLPDYRVSS